MKSLRSPVAIAVAAVMATPPAGAQPVSLRPPTAQATPAPAPPTPPAQPHAPTVQAVTPTSTATPTTTSSTTPGADLHGTSPLPTDLTIAAAAPSPPPPPPPPPAAPPPPPPAVVAQAAPPAPPPPPRIAPAPSATVSVGVQDEYTRLAFVFPAATTVTPSLQGNRLNLTFSRAADIDLADLRATPPRYVREVRKISAAGAPLRLQLTLDYGVRQRNFTDGNRVVVDFLPPDAGVQDAASGSGDVPIPARAPVNGTAHVQLIENANDTRISVAWPAPTRAAAFRRGEAIWLLFDASGRIDLTGVTRAGRRHEDIAVVHGDGVIGLRIPAPPEMQVSATPADNSWNFTLSARAPTVTAAPSERQTAANGQASLRVNFGREGVVRWINDPEIGDRIGVALLGGPARGVDVRRATMEAAILPAAHGAVIEPRADGVTATYDAGVLTVTRGQGLLATSAQPAPAQTALQANLNQALLEQSGAAAASGPTQAGLTLVQVRNQIDQLERQAAEEGVREGAPVTARMALARFLLQNDFAPETLGALRIVGINQGALVELDPEYRLMRGAANVMMGRVAAAQPDLTASALASNPSAALWRGYGAFLQQDWATARSELERGAGALEELSPAWRARFQLAMARATLELGDLPDAEAASNAAMGEATDQSIRLAARLIQARIMAARNDLSHALPMLDQLAGVDDEEVAVQANVEAIRLRREGGVMRAVDAVEPLEALRFRWRGDATELEVVGMLGDVYSEQGRWRDALGVMRTVADRYPNNPAGRQLRADMSTVFERLFLDGEADQLQPIEALGLFYEFSDLTPVGPNGDRIVRLLAGRLVNVDLLEQAAQLLQHQVDERVEGLSKAQVAADLAAIYLMDHKPDLALVALASSRQPNMPQLLLADRRILEARALLDLGRLDGAVELVERDRSEDAQRVRADAAWRSHDWDRAAVELRNLLAMRNRAQPLDEGGRQAVLRQAVALTLDGNDDAVRALYREYAGDMANTPEADAFEVVASGISADGAAIRDVARAVARTDLLDRFLQRLRTRMTADANTPHPAAPATPNAPNAPAAPPPAAAALPAPTNRATPSAASSTPTA